MLQMLFAIAGTGFILLLSEYLCQKRILKGEFARKFVHIITATFAAFWPLFLSYPQIIVLSVIFAITVVIVKKFKILRSLRSVRRATYGEIWYAVGIGISAILFQDNAIYTIAVLHMALADGFAAVVGVGLGKKAIKYRYKNVTKSIAGTATFFVISFALNLLYWFVLRLDTSSLTISPALPVLLSASAAIILSFVEIISPKGSDNVLVPVAAGLLLWIPTTV
jgi:dolichol kinase